MCKYLYFCIVILVNFWVLSDPHEEEKMTVDGVMKFLEDLNLNPESRTVLVIAWRFKAATQCEFTKDEFFNGMTELGYDFLRFCMFTLGYGSTNIN